MPPLREALWSAAATLPLSFANTRHFLPVGPLAAKLHLHFDLLKGAPEHPSLTAAQGSETGQLRHKLEPGRLYVTDRGYFDYDLLAAILAAQRSFLARVRDNIACDVHAENPICAEAVRAGVVADLVVRAGSKGHQQIERPLRLMRIHVPDAPAPRGGRQPNRVDAKTKLFRTRQSEHDVVLLTDQLELDVELLALLFRICYTSNDNLLFYV